jgi:hypothetical protein
MPETNGHEDNLSRLDRIEAAIDQIFNEHEKLIDEHKRLLTAQVVMFDSASRMSANIDRMATNIGASIDRFVERSAAADEALGRRLDAFIEASDRDRRDYNQRLNRLEGAN